MIDRKKFVRASSVRRALNTLGDVSTLLIIGGVFLRARRFDDLLAITQLQKSVLSDRLARLCESDILRKQPLTPDSLRQGYRFTNKGAELQRVALLLLAWEARWDTTPDAQYRIQLLHTDCGNPTSAVPKCRSCGEIVSAASVAEEPGPGEGYCLAQHPRRRRPAPSVAEKHARSMLPGKVNTILGDRWSALVIDSIFGGRHRFDQLLKDTGASSNILADRLKTLSEQSIVDRVASLDDDGRSAFEYVLTEAGAELRAMFLAIQAWGDRWYAAPEGPPETPRHAVCGEELHLRLTCNQCSGVLEGDNVLFRVVSTETGETLDSWRDAIATYS